MTYFIEENAVLISEIARVTKRTEAAVLKEAQRFASVGVDWAGRPAVTAVDAHGLVSGGLQAAAEATQAQMQSQLDAEQYVRDRQEAWNQAYKAVMDAPRSSVGGFMSVTGRVLGGQDAAVKARKAAIDAVEKFERKNPPPATVSAISGSFVRSEG